MRTTSTKALARDGTSVYCSSVAEHAPELDGYIAKYAKGWSFDRIPLVASAIMRVAMYESLYRSDIPTRVAVNEAGEIAKKYETPETVKFINASW